MPYPPTFPVPESNNYTGLEVCRSSVAPVSPSEFVELELLFHEQSNSEAVGNINFTEINAIDKFVLMYRKNQGVDPLSWYL